MVELIITMAVLGIVSTVLTALFVSGSSAQVDQQRRFDAQQTARTALDVLRRDVHYACRLDVNAVSPPMGASITLWFTDQMARGAYDPVGTCVHSAGNSAYDIKASWCTSGSGSRWALYRASGASCSASGATRRADYLTSGAAFTYVAASAASRARLHVDLPVNTHPSSVHQGYVLSDDIALLDTPRQ